MPTEYELDQVHRIVRSRAWGHLSEQESHEHYSRLQKDPGFEPSFRQICDLTQVTELEASAPFLKDLARMSIFEAGTRRAFVARVDLHFGLARMLQTFCDLEGSEVGVFRTVAEAEEWLDLPESGLTEPAG